MYKKIRMENGESMKKAQEQSIPHQVLSISIVTSSCVTACHRKRRKYFLEDCHARYQFLEDLVQSMTKPEAFLRKKRHIAVITKTGNISRKKKL